MGVMLDDLYVCDHTAVYGCNVGRFICDHTAVYGCNVGRFISDHTAVYGCNVRYLCVTIQQCTCVWAVVCLSRDVCLRYSSLVSQCDPQFLAPLFLQLMDPL